jgi:hypothetical protein
MLKQVHNLIKFNYFEIMKILGVTVNINFKVLGLYFTLVSRLGTVHM